VPPISVLRIRDKRCKYESNLVTSEIRGVTRPIQQMIRKGPKNDLEVTIEIPKAATLYVRMPAGELSLEGVSGDKDVELHAGELTISVGNAADYSHVDASVLSGEVDGALFGEYHGGLFRSFHKSGAGKYKLHAHVGAGQLTLQ
jgi:hypothetical protein